MTLIIGSIRPGDVVLTSDGRSTVWDHGKVDRVEDHFQKLFAIPDHPVVIAHMGENFLDNKPLPEFLDGFIRPLNTGNLTITQIADQLRTYAHPAIRARLEAIGHPQFGCNLWVAGFGSYESSPRMVETFWKLDGDVLRTEERHWAPITVVPGGDGQKQIEKVDWRRVAGKSIDEVRAYHQALMDEAMTAKVDPNSVGGHIHEVVITPTGWHWTRPPQSLDNPPTE